MHRRDGGTDTLPSPRSPGWNARKNLLRLVPSASQEKLPLPGIPPSSLCQLQ